MRTETFLAELRGVECKSASLDPEKGLTILQFAIINPVFSRVYEPKDRFIMKSARDRRNTQTSVKDENESWKSDALQRRQSTKQ